MTPITRSIQALAALLTAGFLAVLLIPLTTHAQQPTTQPASPTSGVAFVRPCPPGFDHAIEGGNAIIRCIVPPSKLPPEIVPSPTGKASLVTGFEGIQPGQTISGTVAIQALVADQQVRHVVFWLTGPRPAIHVERRAPYYFMGDHDGTPRGWDTTRFPDGEYMLTAIARGPHRASGVLSIRFSIANKGQSLPGEKPSPTPVPDPTVQPTATQAPAPTATATQAPAPTATATPAPTAPTAPATPGTPSGSVVEQVINLTNQERARVGCPALTASAQLTAAAQGHSDDMARNNFFSHTGSNGSSFVDRIAATGYKYSAAAENIALGYESPAAVVQGWMKSEGHRRNILNCSLREIGVGVATHPNSGNRPYWTQDFATPR